MDSHSRSRLFFSAALVALVLVPVLAPAIQFWLPSPSRNNPHDPRSHHNTTPKPTACRTAVLPSATASPLPLGAASATPAATAPILTATLSPTETLTPPAVLPDSTPTETPTPSTVATPTCRPLPYAFSDISVRVYPNPVPVGGAFTVVENVTGLFQVCTTLALNPAPAGGPGSLEPWVCLGPGLPSCAPYPCAFTWVYYSNTPGPVDAQVQLLANDNCSEQINYGSHDYGTVLTVAAPSPSPSPSPTP
jgi:hypothetical protein